MQAITDRRMLRGLMRGLLAAAAVLLALLVLISVLAVLEGRHDDLRQPGIGRVGAAIVLGAAQSGGQPSPVFSARLDHAFDLYRRGQVRQIILTGGVAPGESSSEAAAGRRYLLARGLPAEVLLAEETSTSTLENLRNSLPLVQAGGVGPVVLVSDPLHMLRALKIARDLGFDAYISPARASVSSGNLMQDARDLLSEAAKYLAYLFLRW